jgi:membrane fusion protein (multidrug efflux system)
MKPVNHRLLFLLQLALAAAFALSSGQVGCRKARPDETGPASDEGVPVRITLVEPGTLRETVRGIGTLQAAETVEIKPEINGFIRTIPFEEGAGVQAEQLLFSIDDRKQRHQLAAAEAALKLARVRRVDAQRRFDRMRELLERGSADQDELDGVETEYHAALAEVDHMEAEAELAQTRLNDTRLLAPFDGIISEHRVDVGDYVTAGDHLATLYRVSQMEIAFTLPERFMGRVRSGQAVAVEVSAYPGRQFEGAVYFVSPQVSESTRDFLVKATVVNPKGLLKPGAFGTAVVTLAVREQCPVVPEEALVATREGYIVFVIEGQAARRRTVRIGLREAGVVEIREGLGLGERIVRAGHMNLSDGVRIRETLSDDKPAAPEQAPTSGSDENS